MEFPKIDWKELLWFWVLIIIAWFIASIFAGFIQIFQSEFMNQLAYLFVFAFILYVAYKKYGKPPS